MALDMWYRSIDTAFIYNNEKEVWQAIANSSVSREDLFVTTKIRIDSFGDATQSAVETSLHNLWLDYLDLVLLHRPTNIDEHHRTLDILLQLQSQQKIRHMWVSNFTTSQLEDAIEYTNGAIYTNQVEYHVFLDQQKMRDVWTKHNVILTAYSPLAHGHIFHPTYQETFQSLGQKYKATIAQIAIARLLSQQHVCCIPKGSSREHLEQNFAAQDIVLSPEDIAILNDLPKSYRYCNPPFAPQRDT